MSVTESRELMFLCMTFVGVTLHGFSSWFQNQRDYNFHDIFPCAWTMVSLFESLSQVLFGAQPFALRDYPYRG